MPTKEGGGFNFGNGIKERLADLMHTIEWELVCTGIPPRLSGPTQHEQIVNMTRMIEYLRSNVSPLFLGEGQCVEHYLASYGWEHIGKGSFRQQVVNHLILSRRYFPKYHFHILIVNIEVSSQI